MFSSVPNLGLAGLGVKTFECSCEVQLFRATVVEQVQLSQVDQWGCGFHFRGIRKTDNFPPIPAVAR